jgi:hypothetical protein
MLVFLVELSFGRIFSISTMSDREQESRGCSKERFLFFLICDAVHPNKARPNETQQSRSNVGFFKIIVLN